MPTIVHQTQDDWLAALQACGGSLDQDDLINLIYKDGPNALWTDMVMLKHQQEDGMDAYLRGMFPTVEWKDWQGIRELGTIYHSAYVPFDMGIFQRSMQICNPGDADECHTDYCLIPRGGISHLPEMEMYRTGFKTQPICIANIRSSKQALQLAKYIIDERFQVDQQTMQSFYTMAVIRMLGHKWVLSYSLDPTTNLPIPTPNNNPRNALQAFDYSYLNPLFPAPASLDDILPLDLNFLDMFGRSLTNSKNQKFIATGPRGEPIFQLWNSEDWYRNEIMALPEYKELMKYTMPVSLLPGYTNSAQKETEVIGNFTFKQMSNLPRFAQATTGGLTVIQPFTTVGVDEGVQAIHNYREWDNAPIGMAVAIGKGLGNIITRPDLTSGVEGQSIMPITGNGNWIYRNDYDKECNEDLNMPHYRKRFEMGFKLTDPDAGWGFLYRNKNFRLRPVNICDLRPMFRVAPADSTCTIIEVGCNPLNKRPMAKNNIITESDVRTIMCQAVACGNTSIYKLEFTRENSDMIAPNQNPLGSCGCGDHVDVIINDENGAFSSKVDGVLVDFLRPTDSHGPTWYVSLPGALSTGDCIHGVVCVANANDSANIIDCEDSTGGDGTITNTKLRLTLDSLLDAAVGDTVVIHWFDDTDSSVGTATCTVSIVDHDTNTFVVTCTHTITCNPYDTAVRSTITKS